MTFAKTDGEDPTQIGGEAAVEGILQKSEVEALHALGDKVAKVIVAGEKVLGDEGDKVAKAVDLGEKTLQDIGDKAGKVVAAGEKVFGHMGGLGDKVAKAVALGEKTLHDVGDKAAKAVALGEKTLHDVGDKVAKAVAAGEKAIGEASEHDLPIFEEVAVTSFTGGKAPGGLPGKAAAAIAGLHLGKNLQLHVASGDGLDVRNFAVQERLSSLFQVSLVAVSDNPSIDFDAVVGHPARFALHAGLHERFWSGLCNHFEQIRVEPSGLSTYQISIVPTLWLLTQRKNHRMFQQISEPDIVLKVLKEWNIDPEVRIDRGAYKKRKYRVQYAESDFAFISRMLEDAGITFYFEQVGEETKVILSDAPQSNEKRVLPLLFMDEAGTTRNHDAGIVTGLRMQQRVRPGKYTLQDHDYRRPPSYKLVSSASGGSGIEDKLERYDYSPGAFLFGASQGDASPVADDKGKTRTDEKEAAILAQKRLDAKRGSARVCTFETTANDLAPGMVMSVVGHPHGALGDGRALLIVESSLNGTDQGEWQHHCEARGTEVPFRPDSATPRPKVNGVESATVVGPKGEEIHTDEFGRVRVHFHWDRESQMDENSSCWIHVSQSWGGAGYGGTNLPRLGQEVLVDFLGGDPDRPVIVGRMYTNLQKTPYSLPLNKTQSGWKSNSTGGGGGYNELMFEDAGGQELLRMQAEKDLHKLVKHDEDVTIGHDRAKLVKNDDTLTVGNDRTKIVKHDETVVIGNDRTKIVKNDDALTVGNDRTKLVQMNERDVVGINRTRVVGVNENVEVGANQSVSVGASRTSTVALASTETVGLAKALSIGGAYAVTVGGTMNTTVLGIQAEEVGLMKTVTAGTKIEITCGKAKLVLEKSGKVTLTGTEFVFESSGPVAIGGDSVLVKGKSGATVTSTGGDVVIKGGPMVKINT
jgi:type VI secretion system secreted protein VgrG